jgi:GDPmannose 4,6-dehydratase
MELSKEELNKSWLVVGSCGQDASFFFEILLEKGYRNIHGIMRRSATFNTQNIDHIFSKLKLYHGDLTDPMNIHNIVAKVKPDYIVNFAAQSHVKVSHELENYTFQTNTLGVLNILQSVRSLGLEKTCKIYHASTSEMYGNQTDGDNLLNENSLMQPVSIYGISKHAAQQICNMYRDAYGMFIVSSFLFNHEGTRRGDTFVTQKIAKYVRELRDKGYTYPLELGNLDAKRDWGDARDYVHAVYLMLMSDKPQNYVIATGETHTVREFADLAFREIGIDLIWNGKGKDELGLDGDGRVLVKVNPYFYRDIDIHCLIGDATKAKEELGWTPTVSFQELVKSMIK